VINTIKPTEVRLAPQNKSSGGLPDSFKRQIARSASADDGRLRPDVWTTRYGRTVTSSLRAVAWFKDGTLMPDGKEPCARAILVEIVRDGRTFDFLTREWV